MDESRHVKRLVRKQLRSRPEAGKKTTLITKCPGVLPLSIGKQKPPTIKRTPLLTP
jgi:hypothetical protein